MKRSLFVLLLAAQPTLAQSPFPAKAVDDAMKAEIEKQGLVGVSIGVIRNGEIAYLKGYGLANRESKVDCDTKTVMNWASNSKPMAGVLAMQLVEHKKLDLDADVRKYVPEFPDKGHVITVRHLLCHQSGIPHYTNGKVIPADRIRTTLDPVIALDHFVKSPLIFKPGEKAEYSSYAFVLLSAVIQRAGGEPYEEQVRKRIQTPLKMDSLELDGPTKGQKHWAMGYIRQGTKIVPAAEEANDWKFGAGGYKSNIEDFAKWAQAIVNRKLVTPESETTMWTAQKLTDGQATNYGLGFVVESKGSSISHNGGQNEVATRMVLDPKAKNGIVILCNCRYANVGDLAKAINGAMK